MTTLILHAAEPAQASETAGALAGELTVIPDGFRINTDRAVDLQQLRTLRDSLDCDINLLPADFDPKRARLLISDMDSTLINIECIDEIGDFLGVKAQVHTITEAAMRGEIDFETSLIRRTALLKGLDAEVLGRVYRERLQLNPGAERLLAGLRARGIQTALVSGGFTYFTDRLKDRLELDFSLANRLEIENGRLTGRVKGEIVGAEGKAVFLRELCRKLEIRPDQTIAIGDGANDLKMMDLAGLSVAYHAKPKVQKQAHCAINHGGLDSVLQLLG